MFIGNSDYNLDNTDSEKDRYDRKRVHNQSAQPYTQHVYPQVPTGGPNFKKMAELDVVLLERPGTPPAQAPKKDQVVKAP